MTNYGIKIMIIGLMAIVMTSCATQPAEQLKTVKVQVGSIKAEIPSTGIVEPRNRLEIKPPISGRIEQVLVDEGRAVKKGAILAWMSSSDRAALLDAARAQGPDEVKKWEDVYKPTPIVAPLNGTIILRSAEPGQTVSLGDALLVMADYLIVKAQVDETDIGNIKPGQIVNIELDAYQGQEIAGRVEHLAYESQTVNNVTIYEVDISPERVPAFFRAGMSATVNFILSEKKNVLVLPLTAVRKVGNQTYVFVQKEVGKKPVAIQITTGLENTLNIEVAEGLAVGAEVVIPTAKMIETLNKRFQHTRGPTNPLQKRQSD